MNSGAINYSSGKAWQAEGIQEYSLVIQVDDLLRHLINAEQEDLLSSYGFKGQIKDPHQITVAKFFVRAGMEQTIERWMQRICSNFRSFIVSFNNYSGYPPHTIYLRIQDYQPFHELIRQLRPIEDYIRSSSCPPPVMVKRPHLPLSAHLSQSVYERAMPDYAGRTFHHSFMAAELLLVKTSPYEAMGKTMNVFRFMPGTYELYQELS